MLIFLNRRSPTARSHGRVRHPREKHNIPTMNDSAADVSPVENMLWRIRLGFDLVVVSGGKTIRGPQSAGILAEPI
jgi:D-glucosaminate-6-phosphate ammonia-lyase